MSRQTLHNYREIKDHFGVVGLTDVYRMADGTDAKQQRALHDPQRLGNKAQEVAAIRAEEKASVAAAQGTLNFSFGEQGRTQDVGHQDQPLAKEHEWEASRYAGGFVYWPTLIARWRWLELVMGHFGAGWRIFAVFLLMAGLDIRSIEPLKHVRSKEAARVLGLAGMGAKTQVDEAVDRGCGRQMAAGAGGGTRVGVRPRRLRCGVFLPLGPRRAAVRELGEERGCPTPGGDRGGALRHRFHLQRQALQRVRAAQGTLLHRLQQTIERKEQELNDLREQKARLPERVDVSTLQNYRSFKQIDNEGKYLFDFVAAGVWNARKQMVGWLRADYDHHNEVVDLFYAITHCHGWVHNTAEAVTVRLEPLQQPQRRAAQEQLCRKLTALGAQTPRGKRLFVEVGESPL